MFLGMNENEKRSFLTGRLIRCDDELSTEETELVQSCAKEAGLYVALACHRYCHPIRCIYRSTLKICAIRTIGLGHADSDTGC